MNSTIDRLKQRVSGFGAGVGWATVALGAIIVPACNAPSSKGLYTPFGDGGAGGGGASSTAGSSGATGGRAGSAGAAGVGGSAGEGGAAAGGGGAGGTPAGGTGGSDPDAGTIDAGVDPDAGVDAGPECGGSSLNGICWYLGAAGQSCNDVCAGRGGFDSAATAVVGTPAQGGAIENCSALLQLLLGNDDDPVVEGTQVAGNGLGCHLFDSPSGQRWWLTTPGFSPEVGVVEARVVCGCND